MSKLTLKQKAEKREIRRDIQEQLELLNNNSILLQNISFMATLENDINELNNYTTSIDVRNKRLHQVFSVKYSDYLKKYVLKNNYYQIGA